MKHLALRYESEERGLKSVWILKWERERESLQRSIRSCHPVLLKLDILLRCSITLYYKMSFKETQEERYLWSWNRILPLGFLRFTQKYFYVLLFPQLAVLRNLTPQTFLSILNPAAYLEKDSAKCVRKVFLRISFNKFISGTILAQGRWIMNYTNTIIWKSVKKSHLEENKFCQTYVRNCLWF